MCSNRCSEDLPHWRCLDGVHNRVPSCFCDDPTQERRQEAPLLEHRREPSLPGGRVVQRHVLYLGEISASQASLGQVYRGLSDGHPQPRTLTLFPEDRVPDTVDDASLVRLRLSEMSVHRPRQWGACWLARLLWRELGLDRFWADRLPPSRKGTRWDLVLPVLVIYRLIAPGSEWRLHREWFESSAMADLLGADLSLAESHRALPLS